MFAHSVPVWNRPGLQEGGTADVSYLDNMGHSGEGEGEAGADTDSPPSASPPIRRGRGGVENKVALYRR